MSRRRNNPDTGEPELTYREQMFINEYIKNGGNGKDAAIAAGYGSARADQSAYQVLHRLQVQQHIRDRISESTVSADEIIGTLVSFMRGNIAQLLDDDGNFDIKLVNKRRLGHLLKTVARTTRKIKTEPGQPPQLAQDYRIQLHSPVQAASILARLKGLNRKAPDFQSDDTAVHESQLDSSAVDCFTNKDQSTQADVVSSITKDILDPSAWMEALIKLEMQRDGRSRSAVIEALLQLRPEAAKYIRPEPDSSDASLAAPSEIEPDSNGAAAPTPQPVASGPSCGQVADLPHSGATVPVDDTDAPALTIQDSNLETPNPPSTTPALQHEDLRAGAPQPSANSPQPAPSELLKQISRVIKNLRKINPTQCLDQDLTQHSASSPLPGEHNETLIAPP